MDIPKNMETLLVTALVDRYYQDHPVGGSLHIVLDDGNIEDDDIEFSINHARGEDDPIGELIGLLMLQLSKTQRLKVYRGRDRRW